MGIVIGHLVLSLLLSGAAVGTLVAGLKFRPQTPLWSLFVSLFLGIWAGGLWISRASPTLLGVAWLPFLLIAILLAVLVVVLAPHIFRRGRNEQAVEREVEVGLGLYFWVLIGGMIAAIVAGYR